MRASRKSLLAATLLMVGFLSVPLYAGRHGSSSVDISSDSDSATSCDEINVRFDGVPALTSEEHLTLPAGSPVDVTAPRNGGIQVSGWSGDHYEVTVCKAADAGSPALLGDVRAEVAGGRLIVSGPSENGWTAHVLVKAPVDAQMGLHAVNGPIGLSGVRGKFSVRAENGPISLKDTGGSIDASTQNGPISLSGGSGDVKLTAQNGPLSVKLNSGSWENGSLEGRTQNGPVSLKLPADFRSGVMVESAGRSPVSCKCEGARETRTDDSYKVEFGSATPATVHLSTKNGPVSIKND